MAGSPTEATIAPSVIATSGSDEHPILVPSADAKAAVEGPAGLERRLDDALTR